MSKCELIGYDRVKRMISNLEKIPSAETMGRVLQYAKADIQRNIETSGANIGISYAPDAPSTIAAKGSSKPLIDRGAGGGLLGSINSRPDGRTAVIVGT